MYKNRDNKVKDWCNNITTTIANSCPKSTPANALTCDNINGPGFDSGWSTSAQYWDTANNRLLNDFERPLSWDIAGDSSDKDG